MQNLIDNWLDSAFRRAMRVSTKSSKSLPAIVRAKSRESARVRTAAQVLKDRLLRVQRWFPSFDQMHPFYKATLSLFVSLDEVKKTLGSITSGKKAIQAIEQDQIRKIKNATETIQAIRARKQAFARFASFMKKLNRRVLFLKELQFKMRGFPNLDPDLPIVVVAGYPNVGKSTIVQKISSANPKIAHYPFTTKEVSVGHVNLLDVQTQIVDTPGILDRPTSERNPIEQQALIAIRYLPDVVVFIFDPSLSCGYELQAQINLFNEVLTTFPSIPIVVAINKVDLVSQESVEQLKSRIGDGECVEVIATEEIGLDNLLKKVGTHLRRKTKQSRTEISPPSNQDTQIVS
ncbi:MAG: NOG1 family protein [Candidatus Hodarchaeota archaeon]